MSNPTKTTAETWRRRQRLANTNQASMFQKYSSWYDLMYAHMNTSQYALWRSKVFLPIIPAKAWSMIAKLQAIQPGFEVAVYGDALNDTDSQDGADKAQWMLEHDWDNPCFDEPMSDKVFSPLVDAVVTGTGIAKIPRTYESYTRYEHIEDPHIEDRYDMTKDTKVQGERSYNDLIPHDIMATYMAPGAKRLQNAAWVILEDFVTYDDLKAINDNANPDGKGKDVYKNLNQVKDLKATNDPNAMYKKARERLTSSADDITTDTTVQQFRRYECYEKRTNLIYTYAAGQSSSGDSDEWIELECKPNPFWHGKYPLVMFYTKKRPHSVWGQGIFEDTERMQSAFNDLFNHLMDQLNMTDGMIMKKESEEYNYTVEPGGEFLYKNEKPEQFKFPEPSYQIFTMALNFIESQVEDSTISSYAQGTPNSATDKTNGTAAGIASLQNAAGDKIGFMKQNYSTTMREVGQMWLSNNQQFMSDETTLMGTVKGRRKPVKVKPKDIQGQMTLRINDASMEPESKEQRLTSFLAYVQQLMQFQAASVVQAQQTKWATEPVYIDYASLIEDASQKFGQAHYDKILLDNKEVEQAMQNSSTPMVTPNERINIVPTDLKPSEMAQLLQRNGITPDPTRAQDEPLTNNQATTMVNAAKVGQTGATPPTAEPEAPQLTPADIIAAAKHDHQATMDKAKFGLEVHKQIASEAQVAQQPQEPVGAPSGR